MYKFLLILCIFAWCQAARVTFYKEKNLTGQKVSWNTQSSICYNLPVSWNNAISSVFTHGGCLMVYDNPQCSGQEEQITSGTRSHRDLSELGFDKRMGSFKTCSQNQENCVRFSIALDLVVGEKLKNTKQRFLDSTKDLMNFACSQFLQVPGAHGTVRIGNDNKLESKCCQVHGQTSQIPSLPGNLDINSLFSMLSGNSRS